MQYMCISLSNCYKFIQIFSFLIGYGSKYRTDVIQVCGYRSGDSCVYLILHRTGSNYICHGKFEKNISFFESVLISNESIVIR